MTVVSEIHEEYLAKHGIIHVMKSVEDLKTEVNAFFEKLFITAGSARIIFNIAVI